MIDGSASASNRCRCTPESSTFASVRGATARWAWAIPVVVAGALVLSSWVAVRTGEAEEDRVERVIAKGALHEHEEAAERFPLLASVLLLVSAPGLAGGSLGRAGRLLSTVGAVGLVFAGAHVGAAGRELVYRHGAANAFVESADRATVTQPDEVALVGEIGVGAAHTHTVRLVVLVLEAQLALEEQIRDPELPPRGATRRAPAA
jgi:hypothetical protein